MSEARSVFLRAWRSTQRMRDGLLCSACGRMVATFYPVESPLIESLALSGVHPLQRAARHTGSGS